MLAGLASVLLAGCASVDPAGSTPPAPAAGLRYVALGDSYTIGTSVDPTDRWPNQLVERLGTSAPTLRLVANLAVNGFTSGDVIDRQLPRLAGLDPEFATLLVGVNDVVRGVSVEAFEANAGRILDDLLGRLAADRIVVVSTPDYTVTPQGAEFGNPAARSAAIVRNNAGLRRLAIDRGIAFVDIVDLSLRAAGDRSLVADDGLHPSGAQYALWVDRIEPVVRALLEP
jgi:lysophospholipase L1-like esterase